MAVAWGHRRMMATAAPRQQGASLTRYGRCYQWEWELRGVDVGKQKLGLGALRMFLLQIMGRKEGERGASSMGGHPEAEGGRERAALGGGWPMGRRPRDTLQPLESACRAATSDAWPGTEQGEASGVSCRLTRGLSRLPRRLQAGYQRSYKTRPRHR